jgi:ABC-type glycerol-3-phosphate transport system substrate-binding protein
MALEDIKSPLPPRRFSSLYDPEDEKYEQQMAPKQAEVSTDKVVEMPTTNMTPPSSPSGLSVAKPVDFKKIGVIVGIVGLIGLIVFLVFKVILPNLGAKKAENITLTYWGLWEEPATLQSIIADYESKNPGIKINYVRNQKVNYRTRLKTRIEGGGEDSPDIFRYHSSWIPMFKSDLAKVPSDVASSTGLDSDFFEAYKNTIKINGSWQGIPLMYDGLSLFYNKDLVASGGVSLPKSWWDLEQAASKLTVRDSNGKITVSGAALGLVDNVDHWSDIVGLMLKQGGVDPLLTDADSQKKLQDVLTYYSLFKTKYQVWDEALPSSTELFANGKLAFYFAPSWRAFNIEEMKIPELKYEITTVPQLPTLKDVPPDQVNNEANLTNIHWSTYWVEGVSSKSKNQKEAWKFLQFMAQKDNLEKMYTAAAQIRSFGEIYPRKSMAEKMESNPLTRPFVKVANNADGWYLSSRTFDEGLNDEMAKYFADAINGLSLKSLTVEIVMPDLRNGLNQMMQKYSLK